MRQQIAPAAAGAGGAAAQAAQAAPTTFEREPERAPTVSARPPGELGLADLYTQRVQQGRAPASPRDHIIFGGNRSEVQAGTKFASGGFPYLFVIVRVQRSVPTHHTHTRRAAATRARLSHGRQLFSLTPRTLFISGPRR
jgi:hypothetical protein